MKRFLMPFLLSLLLLWHGVSPLVEYVQGNLSSSSGNFSSVFRALYMLVPFVSVLLLISAAKPVESYSSEPRPGLMSGWLAGFFMMILLTIVLVVYADPHARFTGDRFPPVTPGARIQKISLYKELAGPPHIVILGSSRAFTLSPDYIKKVSGFDAYNMSVEGGRTGDYLVQLNYMLETDAVPRVLVVDVNTGTFSNEFFSSDLQPLMLIPYMPLQQAWEVAGITLQDTLSIRSLSDASYLYLLTFWKENNIKLTWTFETNGFAIRQSITEQQYQKSLKQSISQVNTLNCRRFTRQAQNSFGKFIALAQENGIGVVLHIPPVHPDLYQASYEKNPESFERCRRMLGEYLEQVEKKYTNIKVQDLLDYEPVTQLGYEGFYDALHITPHAAELVVDALLPDIQTAMEWSFLQEAQK